MTSTATPPVKLNRTQAAEYIGVTHGTLTVWASRGRGPRFVKVGRKVWYLQDELDKWMEERTTNCTSELN